MTVDELRDELRRSGVSPDAYILDGSGADGAYYLRAEDGRWIGGSFDRGTYWPEWLFESEDQACRTFLALLTKPALLGASGESAEAYERRRQAHLAATAPLREALDAARARLNG
ncbi:hypothetical protein D5S17_15685 [Pseudonocardiaceae bacterium YIM PH 21723]|nr:hypothetical protein D5S17_15685 [Pseudonocardiaceae bacterium YIM PH 21723]